MDRATRIPAEIAALIPPTAFDTVYQPVRQGPRYQRTEHCEACGTEYPEGYMADKPHKCAFCGSGCQICAAEICDRCQQPHCIGCMEVDLPIAPNSTEIGSYCPVCAPEHALVLLAGEDFIVRTAKMLQDARGRDFTETCNQLVAAGAKEGKLSLRKEA